MKISELKERKRELGYTNQMIANISGVPLGTVQKIFAGVTTSPRRESLLKIERALFPENFGGRPTRGIYDNTAVGYYDRMTAVREDSLAYDYVGSPDSGRTDDYNFDRGYIYRHRQQGEFTVDDILSMPEDIRVELIDGRIYDMAAPTTVHQFIVTRLLIQLSAHIDSTGKDCIVFPSPVGVKLDDRTMVEPDISVVCDKSKFIDGLIVGGPDLIAEVLSPSTRSKDLILKLHKYWNFGVREYWIIDPSSECVTVYRFEEGVPSHQYTFNDRIPVGISGGECIIDFKSINDKLHQYFG